MKIGIHLDAGGDAANVPAEARRIEELGFDSVAAGEHVFFYGPTSNAFLTLAAAAAVTERIGLLSALTILPLYPLALLAKQAATLDQLSRGRFDLGLGLAGEYPAEFAASGVTVAGRGARADEALPVLRALLAGETLSAEGGYGRFDNLRLNPPPVGPPAIWMGGRKAPPLRRVGRWADGWLPYMLTPERYAEGLAEITAVAAEAGREPGAVSPGMYFWGALDPDAARARAEAVEVVSGIYQQDFGPIADRYLLHGDPDGVLSRLAEFAAAGVESVIFAPACEPQRRAAMIELFARDVLPRARTL